MELMEAMRTRRSVRRYAAKPVERATIDRLLEAATLAPSASNDQPWAFGVIQGAESLRRYSDRAKVLFLRLIEGNPAFSGYRRAMSNPDYNIFHNAPTLICVYARPAAWPYPKNDCALAAQNLMLAAHDLGLGSCWVGFGQWLFDSAELKGELGVPAEYQAVGQLVVGYPQAGLPAPTSRRPPEVLFWK